MAKVKLMGLEKALHEDTVSSLPLREAVVVEPATIVRAAVAKMRTKQLGCAVIVDSGGPRGVFTERSVIDVLVQDASLDNRIVDDFTDRDFLQIKTSDLVISVWDAILRDGFRFACVTDDDGKLVGLTGQRGLAEYVSELFPGHDVAERAFAEKPVRSIQMRPYAELHLGGTIREAVHALHGLKVASLLVTLEKRLVGIFTERDVLERVAEQYGRLQDAPLSEVMTSDPLSISSCDPVRVALAVIASAGYRHVPVLNEANEAQGIVSPRRVLNFLQEQFGTSLA